MTEYDKGYSQGRYDEAVRQEARRTKKKMTLKLELKAMRAGRIPLPDPTYPGERRDSPVKTDGKPLLRLCV
jgi:hypothetical protein